MSQYEQKESPVAQQQQQNQAASDVIISYEESEEIRKQKEAAELEQAIHHCKAEINNWTERLHYASRDLEKARENNQDLGPYYNDIHRCEDKIEHKKRELRNYEGKCGRDPGKPDLKERQISIGGAAVSRNESISNTSIVKF